MPGEKKGNYECILDQFLNDYRKVCMDYILAHREDFSGEYFKNWYQATGNPALNSIERNLNLGNLDERVKGFTDLYNRYIEAAQKQGDEDLLLENLFAVPEQMQYEFSMFGFLYTEAASSEGQWQKFDLPKAGGCLLNKIFVTSGNVLFQNDGGSGFDNLDPVF